MQQNVSSWEKSQLLLWINPPAPPQSVFPTVPFQAGTPPALSCPDWLSIFCCSNLLFPVRAASWVSLRLLRNDAICNTESCATIQGSHLQMPWFMTQLAALHNHNLTLKGTHLLMPWLFYDQKSCLCKICSQFYFNLCKIENIFYFNLKKNVCDTKL